jgi:RNA polymerase sigma-70 factor (ECF subfamily)
VKTKQGQNLEHLMVCYQKADAQAGAALVDALSQSLFQFFRAQARSRQDAEDLLQDLWLRVHHARATYRPGEPVLPWLYSIAHRVRIDHYRKSRRMWQHEVADESLLQNAKTPIGDGLSAGASVAAMLQTLPDSQRELLLMLKVSGLSLEEAARATGSTIGAVKQKAHRAYEKLRKLLGGEA